MVKKISDSLRIRILYESGIKNAYSIHRRTGIPLRTCFRKIRALIDGVFVDGKVFSERKKKIVPGIQRKVIRKIKTSKRIMNLRYLASYAGISHESVRFILKKHSFTYSRLKKRIFLSKEAKKKRMEWALDMVKRESDWPFIVISDECSFWLNKCVPHSQWVDDTDEISGPKLHGPKIHVWGAITARGAIPLQLFEENLNAIGYVHILRKAKPFMDQLYPEGYIFQQDNDPKHTSDVALKFLERFPNTLEWPAYSPDLSPIENVWGWLKGEVCKDRPKTMSKLKFCIKNHWNRITPLFLEPYFETMPKRIEKLINCNGNKLNN